MATSGLLQLYITSRLCGIPKACTPLTVETCCYIPFLTYLLSFSDYATHSLCKLYTALHTVLGQHVGILDLIVVKHSKVNNLFM